MTTQSNPESDALTDLIANLPDLLVEEKKSVSIERLERAMAGLDADLVEGIPQVTEAIERYRAAKRNAKEDPWNDLVEAVGNLAVKDEADEDEIAEEPDEPTPPAAPPARPPAPTANVPGGRDPDDLTSIGQWFRGQFLRAGNAGASPADLYKTIRATAEATSVDFRGATYASWFREFWWLKQVKYVERTGRTAPSFQRGRRPGDRKGGTAGFSGVLKSPKVFYRLTKKGRESDPATWENLTALVHADRLEPFWWRQYQPLTGRPRGRPAREVLEETTPGRTGRRRAPTAEPAGPQPAPAPTEGGRRVKMLPELEVRNQLILLRDTIRGLAVQWSAGGAATLQSRLEAVGRLLATRIDRLETLEDEKKPMSAEQRASLAALRDLVESYDDLLEQAQTFARRWGERGPSGTSEKGIYDQMLGQFLRSLPSPA